MFRGAYPPFFRHTHIIPYQQGHFATHQNAMTESWGSWGLVERCQEPWLNWACPFLFSVIHVVTVMLIQTIQRSLGDHDGSWDIVPYIMPPNSQNIFVWVYRLCQDPSGSSQDVYVLNQVTIIQYWSTLRCGFVYDYVWKCINIYIYNYSIHIYIYTYIYIHVTYIYTYYIYTYIYIYTYTLSCSSCWHETTFSRFKFIEFQ